MTSPGPGLPTNWAKFSRALAEDLAREHGLDAPVRRGIRMAIYRALQLAHTELPAVRARDRATGLQQAHVLVANLPDGTTAAEAARALDAAITETRSPHA